MEIGEKVRVGRWELTITGDAYLSDNSMDLQHVGWGAVYLQPAERNGESYHLVWVFDDECDDEGDYQWNDASYIHGVRPA